MLDLKQCSFIITEKPDAANRIAQALDIAGRPKKIVDNGVPYFLAENNGEIIVVPALGHLYTVTDRTKSRNQYPVFNMKWVPRYEAERGAHRIRKWLDTISKLAKKADNFIDACDYDIEGSIIGYSILKYSCGNKENISKRMKYSTLTKDEIEKSYKEMLPHLDFASIEAGLTRHEIDWLYGVNVSRALTIAAKKWSGMHVILSTGRVQGPTLKLLAAREKSIKSFVPTPYWTVKVRVKMGDSDIEIVYEKKIMELKEEAEAVASECRGKTGKIESVETEKFQQIPPFPFDLGSLQKEAYRLFGYTPIRTSSIAQRLYLDALISYPRTSSQKLPSSIGYRKILEKLAEYREYRTLATLLLANPDLKPIEGQKEDSAHPAIYPTGNLPGKTLDPGGKNIYDLVVRRFMSTFAKPSMHQRAKIIIDIGGNRFFTTGLKTLKEGWLRFYGPFIRSEDSPLPALKEGQTVNVERVLVEDKFSKPYPRFNPSSLLKRMEDLEIGTKATRAGIIQTLYDRKYIRDERIQVTDLGLEVVEILKKYCPQVVSVELTKKLEERMDQIQQGKTTKEQVINSAIKILMPLVEKLRENEPAIGEGLNRAVKATKIEEKVVGTCQKCLNGNLVILHSKKTGKRFIGCTNYFKAICKTSFPLPQKGAIKPLGKVCEKCGWPTVGVRMKSKRLWKLCVNTECPSKKMDRNVDP